MQPRKAQREAHERAEATRPERLKQHETTEARRIAQEIDTRVKMLLDISSEPKEDRSQASLPQSEIKKDFYAEVPTERHFNFNVFIGHHKGLGTKIETSSPVELGHSVTESGEKLTRFGRIVHETVPDHSTSGITEEKERIRFIVEELDENNVSVIPDGQEIAVLEEGELIVSEKRARKERPVSSKDDPVYTLVCEMIDGFEKRT